MKKTFLILPLLLFLFSSSVLSQSATLPIEYRFKGGLNGFLEYIYLNAFIPVNSRSNNSIGLSVSKISVTPQGTISEIEIINPIDPYIDKMVTQLLSNTNFGWLKSDTIEINQNFYLQIAFAYLGLQKKFIDKSDFPSYKMFIEPVVLTTSPGSTDQEKLPKDDDSLIKQSTELIAAGEYKEALLSVDELIKRYPYTKELYQFRMMINKKLDDKLKIEKDAKKISDFADGLSIDSLFIIN